MKNVKLRIVSLTMAFAVLFSSTGYGMYVHTCKITQKKSFTFSSADTCCEATGSSEGQTAFTKYKCCSIVKSLNKVSVNQTYSYELSLSIDWFALPKHISYYFPQKISSNQAVSICHLANPPPIYGKLLLAFIQSYLI